MKLIKLENSVHFFTIESVAKHLDKGYIMDISLKAAS